MRTFSLQLLILCLLLPAAACERGPKEPPPVTIGKPAGSSISPPEAEQNAPDPDAESSQEDALNAAPTRELSPGTEEQLDLLNRARIAFVADYQEIAEEYFLELVSSEPPSGATVSAAIALGQIYLESGRTDAALELMDQLQEHARDLPEVLLITGRTYASQNEYIRALQAYDRALQRQPDYIFLLVDMAELLFEIEEEERAAQLLLRYERRLEEMAFLLESPDESTLAQRNYILDIFSMIEDERAHQAMIGALDDPDPEIRAASASSLGQLYVPDAVDPLERLAIDDPDPTVRHAARQALDALKR